MKKFFDKDSLETTEQEILSLLRRMETGEVRIADDEEEDDPIPAPAVATPAPPSAIDKVVKEVTEDIPATQMAIDNILSDETPEVTNKVETEPIAAEEEEEPATAGGHIQELTDGICPKRGDSAGEIVRKCVFFCSLLVFLGALGMILYYMVLEPHTVATHNEHYAELFRDETGNNEEKDAYNYPTEMRPSFRQLYDINKDIAGWISYVSTDKNRFLNIDLPIVWCGDNETYLDRGLDGKYNRSGTLFFDRDNTFIRRSSNRVTIVYGHNMASGAMFAHLNKMLGSPYYARSAPLISLDTLYDSAQYKVFAVVLSDEDAQPKYRFGYLRTAFVDDNDFMTYIEEIRARSVLDFPVEVNADDEILILSTCTNKSQAKLANGRCAVIARRVRDGENPDVNTAKIKENEDVIMPYQWYEAQDLTPHVFYTQTDYHVPSDSTVDTTTAATQNTTINTTGNDSTTTQITTSQTMFNTSNNHANTTVGGSNLTSRVTEHTTTELNGNTNATPPAAQQTTAPTTIQPQTNSTTSVVKEDTR